MGWLTGWIARKSKHIDGTGNGELTDFQVGGLTLHHDTGTDDDTNVYLPYCQSDFRDVRFTEDDGETLIPFYLSGSGDSRSATANISSIPSGGVDVYIYYGNRDAADASSGADTFILFDDFTTDQFTDVGTPKIYVDVPNQRIEATAMRDLDERTYKDIGVQGNVWRMDFTFDSGEKSGTYGGVLDFGLYDTLANYQGNPGDFIGMTYYFDSPNLTVRLGVLDAGVESSDTAFAVGAATVYVTLIRQSATAVWMGVYSDEERTTHVSGSPSSLVIGATIDDLRYVQGSNRDYGTYPTEYVKAWIELLSMSKYSDPAPAWAATGEEELTPKVFAVGARIGHNFAGLKVSSLWTPKVFKTSGGRIEKPAGWLSLREQPSTSGANPATLEWSYHVNGPAYLDMWRSYVDGVNARGFVFFVANTGYLHGKKVKVDWQDPSGVWWDNNSITIYDGSYDRSSDTDFPDFSSLKPKGSGKIKTIAYTSNGFARETKEWLCDLSPAQLPQVTLFVTREAEHNVACHLYIYSIQILDASDNLLVDFSLTPITMEREATIHDYGYTGTLS